MLKVVEVEPANGIHFHVFDQGAFGHMAHVVVVIAKLEWNKRVEAPGFILQLPQAFHMVDAVAVMLYMAIQQGRIAVHAQQVGLAVYV